MKIVVAGATGFVGQPLVQSWLDQGHEVVVIGRTPQKILEAFGGRVKTLTWEGLKMPQGLEVLSSAEAVVNLAGASIAQRWTSEYKKDILRSRVESTQAIAQALSKIQNKKMTLINAGAVGIYGTQTPVADGLPEGFTEDFVHYSQRQAGFLTQVCDEWEAATKAAKDSDHRVVVLRIGVVLGKNGGALQKMALPFWMMAGGPIGDGRQPLPWVSRHDLCSIINFCLKRSDMSGPVNAVAPMGITQKEFARVLGRVIHRPSFMPTPGFALKLILGDMADELLLKGQNVLPQKLQKAGFMFEHPDAETALRAIYTS